MNILFIHETDYIDKVVYEYQIIPELLSSQGHRVIVIDYPDKWRKKHFFDFGNFKTSYLKNIRKADKKKGITLIRPGIIKIPVISRIIASIEYFFLIPQVIKKYQIEKIVLYSAPTNGLQTIFWAKKYKIPVMFRLLDVLHELVPYNILSWPTKEIEKIAYRKSNEVLAITPRLTKYAIAMGANKKTTGYLPSGADSDLFYFKTKDRALMKKCGLTDADKVILFAGTLYNFSGLDIILDYFAKNQKKYPRLKFMIVGHGIQEKTLRHIITQYHLEDKIILTGFVEYENLPKYINLADICINPFEINKVTDIIFPGKIYQYLACQKPVITTKLPGVMEIFPDNGGRNHLYYFNLNQPKEFFDLTNKITNKKYHDPNPSLQKITKIIEKKLKSL